MNFDIKQIRKEVEYIFNSYPGHDMLSMSKAQAFWLIERVEEMENRNKELEYASKHNGELNEFLQKRKLPPNTLGRHVVDVVMDYVEELEEENKKKQSFFNEISDLQLYVNYTEEELYLEMLKIVDKYLSGGESE